MSYLKSMLKEDCYGCGACVDICPKKAIKMVPDKEGFLYPIIDTELCINCKLCEKTCPKGYDCWVETNKVRAYYGIANDEIVFKSSSGGAFTAIYLGLLEQKYSIYGVKFDDNFQVVHDRADTVEECELFRKSKYVQSNTNNVYLKIENQLLNNEKVCFSGTPCQCAALNKYLEVKKVPTKNLLTVSLLCHGVPNQMIFDKYIKELEKRRGNGKIKKYSFKCKELIDGKYNSRSALIEFQSGKKQIVNMSNDVFLRGYYFRLFYRYSCGKCEFARKERVSDITIADAWKIEKIDNNLNPLKGVSLILFNTDKGFDYIDIIMKNIELKEISTEWALESQALMKRPTDMHDKRNRFFRLYQRFGVHFAVKACTWKTEVKAIAKRLIKKL